MKKFRFRLERLLHIRKVMEREQARLLQEQVTIADGCRRALQDSAERRNAMIEQLGVESSRPQTAGTLSNLALTVDAAENALLQCERVLENAEENVKVEGQKYRETRKDLRAIEKMRERQYEKWVSENLRADQNEFDEIAGRVSAYSTGDVE